MPSGIAAADRFPDVISLCDSSHGFVGADGGGLLEFPIPPWLHQRRGRGHDCDSPVPSGIAAADRSPDAMSHETSLCGFPHGFVGPGPWRLIGLEFLSPLPWLLQRLEARSSVYDCGSPVPFGIAAADKLLILGGNSSGGGGVAWCGVAQPA